MKPINELLDLKGKTVVVTGAVGIGFGIAYRLAEAGANVIIGSLYLDEAQESVQKINEKGWIATAVECDVSSEEDVKNLLEQTVKVYGGVDILVNNAGIYPSVPLMKMTPSDFRKVLDVNLIGAFLCTKYAAEQMIKQGKGGKIINITSVDALHPSMIGLAHYDASKHGLWGFTKNAALELAPHEIWVNAIAPGGILTEGVKASQKNTPEGIDMSEVMQSFLNKIPMKRMGDPDEIGKVALFLASDMSSYITGTQIVVDGGVLLS